MIVRCSLDEACSPTTGQATSRYRAPEHRSRPSKPRPDTPVLIVSKPTVWYPYRIVRAFVRLEPFVAGYPLIMHTIFGTLRRDHEVHRALINRLVESRHDQ